MTTIVINEAPKDIKGHLRAKDSGNTNNVVISAKDFTADLGDLDCEEEFDYYTRDNRGHFRFYTKDGQKLPVSVSPAAVEAMPRALKTDSAEPMDILEHCLGKLTLRSGVSGEGRPFLSFGVIGEGNLRTGKVDLKAFIKAWAK